MKLTDPSSSSDLHKIDAKYTRMILQAAQAPLWHFMAAMVYNWVCLVGLIMLHGTFEPVGLYATAAQKNHVKNIPLLGFGGVFITLGVLGLLAFWVTWRRNWAVVFYFVFVPGFLNGLVAGTLTLVMVYTAERKTWSHTAYATSGIELVQIIFCAAAIIWYWSRLSPLKEEHDQKLHEMTQVIPYTLDLEQGRRESPAYAIPMLGKNDASTPQSGSTSSQSKRPISSPGVRVSGVPHIFETPTESMFPLTMTASRLAAETARMNRIGETGAIGISPPEKAVVNRPSIRIDETIPDTSSIAESLLSPPPPFKTPTGQVAMESRE